MRFLLTVLGAMVLFTGSLGPIEAQTPASPVRPRRAEPAPVVEDMPAQDMGDALELNADLVLVSAAVLKSAGGGPIRDLDASDFTILDEGVPQEIAFFGDEGVPLDVAFLFDASQSVQFRRQFQREALTTFLRTLLRPSDSAAIFWFSDHVHVEQDFTAESRSLAAAVDRIPQGGATALYSAIASASTRIGRRNGRRAIVILSDGRDTFSEVRLEDALRAALSADAVIFAINTSFARWAVTQDYRDNDPLEYLAAETGGEVYYSANPGEVEDVLSRLSSRLRERYVLGFYPSVPNANGMFRRLRVNVKRKNAHIMTRSGYYAR